MNFKIAVLPGDGIGQEVTEEALKVFEVVAEEFGHTLDTEFGLVGGAALDAEGVPISDSAMEMCNRADAILFGAVGLPKYDTAPMEKRPELALFRLRKGFELYANLRPVKNLPALQNASNLKPEVLAGVDLVVVRELTGGLYFGKPAERYTDAEGRKAVDTLPYSEQEISRIVRTAFELARQRNGKKRVTSVDKANVLHTSRLWREVATEVGQEYPDIALEHLLVDATAMNLIRKPAAFDVIVTENMFGDILTDEASMLAGSMGLLASASLGTRHNEYGGQYGMYEPIHGTAPDITGQGIANPLAAIGCVAMLLRSTFGLEKEASTIEEAIEQALNDGLRTPDLYQPGTTKLNTIQMGDAVAERVRTKVTR
ncbi:MAG: 3-isopropylmalate dehydrogenase [Chloroflexi bacterium]|uniref:3-isopropylmalate dehydrogenase n=1 Tax=Candidatus Chlorohelix allophototropha TaxID=3003348 RepID=A0A8T7LXJ6_9CHLR|nr:3-isopropylmalate dehydrogenase [Chloroflexota bacterium]WJW67470.1 3-isopropylmalate dehydrogenase [Chloroflexota bacterium L227-S17]